MLRFIHLLIATALFILFPIVVDRTYDGDLLFRIDYAYADKGREDEDEGDDDDDEDEDDDDEYDDDDEDDRSGSDSDDTSASGGGGSSSGDNSSSAGDNSSSPGGSSKSDDSNTRNNQSPKNLHLRYSNGWNEQILDGQYLLTDPKGRTVSSRTATHEDHARMRALVSE